MPYIKENLRITMPGIPIKKKIFKLYLFLNYAQDNENIT